MMTSTSLTHATLTMCWSAAWQSSFSLLFNALRTSRHVDGGVQRTERLHQ